jgi:hypothetical protein
MASEELTRFPITPQDRHQTAKSSEDIEARPEEQRPGKREKRPQDKPVTPPSGHDETEDEDKPDDLDVSDD